MAYQHQVFESPNEGLAQQSKYPQVYDKNGQHIEHCVFRERGFEPWPKKYLKYILMEWYIFLNERHFLPGTWDCPLPRCDKHFNTFGDVITHIDGDYCIHLTPTTRQYTCPGCGADVEMPAHTCPGCQAGVQAPAVGHGNKAMLKMKIRRSLDNIRCHLSPRSRPSSAASSPISASFPSDASPSQKTNHAAPMPHAPSSTNFNAQAPHPCFQHNRNASMVPIITQSLPAPHEMCSNEPYLSSTTSNSSYELSSTFSAQGALSTASFSQLTWSPTKLASSEVSELSCLDGPNLSPWGSNIQSPYNVQHFGDLPCPSTLAELPDHDFLQDATNFGGTNIGGMMPCYPLDCNTNINYSDVEKECQVGLMSFPQDRWNQQEGVPLFVQELSVDSHQEHYTELEVAADAVPTHDLFSPASTDVVMADTPPTTDGSSDGSSDGSPQTDDSLGLECEICGWKPDMTGKRSPKQLRLAVEKHHKRNHQSKDYHCLVCNQPFRNRPDNVKPHVVRKHPEMVDELYPKTALDGFRGEKAGAPAKPPKPAAKRRASMPLPNTQASPTRVRYLRSQRV